MIMTSLMQVDDDECKSKTLSSALEEVSHKGTLIDRLMALENRLFKLSLSLDIENTSRSSSKYSTNIINIPQAAEPEPETKVQLDLDHAQKKLQDDDDIDSLIISQLCSTPHRLNNGIFH
ncbi:hypothetical protein COLO4_25085 [Corchorus olitorius]|uniref:Uncharacterized protein n=1 Tax=Corchorus olitorius TaxID=93759 RepID=A0A1R3I4S5_9ROSI|nr:hypothetical protein COLO4_25085 [Corchorus olitorius]